MGKRGPERIGNIFRMVMPPTLKAQVAAKAKERGLRSTAAGCRWLITDGLLMADAADGDQAALDELRRIVQAGQVRATKLNQNEVQAA